MKLPPCALQGRLRTSLVAEVEVSRAHPSVEAHAQPPVLLRVLHDDHRAAERALGAEAEAERREKGA